MTTQNSRRRSSSDDGRLSRSDYFAAGMAILAEEGPRKLTTTNICERIGVTRGSFYHHFSSGPMFRKALIAHWEADVYTRAEDAKSAQADSYVRALKLSAISAQHRAERAIRGWSYEDSHVAEAQRRVDKFRQAQLVRVFEELGVDTTTATTLADMGVALYAGLQVVEGPDRQRRRAVVDVYDTVVRSAGDGSLEGPTESV
ncbi:TetR/AcrR family transcriptional regulator [Rhodococcus sp. NPDC003382]